MKCMGIENDPEVILMLNEMRKETIQLEQMVQEVCALVVPKRPLIALYCLVRAYTIRLGTCGFSQQGSRCSVDGMSVNRMEKLTSSLSTSVGMSRPLACHSVSCPGQGASLRRACLVMPAI